MHNTQFSITCIQLNSLSLNDSLTLRALCIMHTALNATAAHNDRAIQFVQLNARQKVEEEEEDEK